LSDYLVFFLWYSLYKCIYVAAGKIKPSRDILNNPVIANYVENWGHVGDEGFIATIGENQQPIGAAWYRLFQSFNPGYGYVNDETPELSIAVVPHYRGKGVGQSLLIQLLQKARLSSSRQVSLSVDPSNPAVHLYQKLGFERIGISGTSWVMTIELNQSL
jgi:ribosomal protein S18 acetylase RimI-like enzyme